MASRELSGRRGEARRNDAAILASARDVFVADPDAPVSAVAKRAGVGISSLYRRYTSKEELLRTLCSDGLQQYVDIAREAVEDEGSDPWDVFARFMRRIVEADTHTLTINLAGRFTPTEREGRNAVLADRLNRQLVARAQTAGVLRDDLTADDLTYVFEQIAGIPRRDAAAHRGASRPLPDAAPRCAACARAGAAARMEHLWSQAGATSGKHRDFISRGSWPLTSIPHRSRARAMRELQPKLASLRSGSPSSTPKAKAARRTRATRPPGSTSARRRPT